MDLNRSLEVVTKTNPFAFVNSFSMTKLTGSLWHRRLLNSSSKNEFVRMSIDRMKVYLSMTIQRHRINFENQNDFVP